MRSRAVTQPAPNATSCARLAVHVRRRRTRRRGAAGPAVPSSTSCVAPIGWKSSGRKWLWMSASVTLPRSGVRPSYNGNWSRDSAVVGKSAVVAGREDVARDVTARTIGTVGRNDRHPDRRVASRARQFPRYASQRCVAMFPLGCADGHPATSERTDASVVGELGREAAGRDRAPPFDRHADRGTCPVVCIAARYSSQSGCSPEMLR